MIDVTRAIQLGWVEECDQCREGRAALDQLRHFYRQDRQGNTTATATNLDEVSIRCHKCDSRGWKLTGDGQMLVDLVQELYPDLVKKPEGEEIPF